MPANEFPRALAASLVHEGGWSNHPKDPGGATMKGVTQRVYDAYRRGKSLPIRSVRDITESELQEIYRRQYWDEIKGDQLPAGVAYCVFDYAVNSGPRRAILSLQKALGMANIDGQAGLATIAAANDHGDHDRLVAAICEERLRFVRALKTFATFGKGWTRRIVDVKARAQAWASGSVGTRATYIEGAENKAKAADAKPRPMTAPADAAVAVGTGSGGIAGTLQQTREQLEPLAGTSEWIGTTVAVLAVVSAVSIIGGLVWRWWKSREAKEIEEALA